MKPKLDGDGEAEWKKKGLSSDRARECILEASIASGNWGRESSPLMIDNVGNGLCIQS
jgi:hypothetical protein